MKTWTIGLMIWIALGSWLAAADDVKLDAAWQGKWQVTAMHSGDVELPEEFVKKISMQVEQANMTWQVNDQSIKARVTFVGTEDKPRPIDIVGVGGENDGRLYEGIYELADDVLKLCLNTTTNVKQRPIEFAAPAGSTFVVIEFKKEKK
ncbi:MAG: TIGR03067 domain-containing protein [Planctomycetaceae bacterium]|nr:TIGR03067 domain-containing protein [Planctomycetaceae bacterium]